MTPADSPENKCPTCDGDGSVWCGLGINPHLAPCPACGGSGRINTSGPSLCEVHAALNCKDCFPSVPDRETGLTAEQKARIEGIVDGVLVSFEQGKVAGRRLGEGRLSPSAAPTNSVPSRSDSEGEEAAFERGRESRQGEIDALETEIKSLHARLKKRYGKKVR